MFASEPARSDGADAAATVTALPGGCLAPPSAPSIAPLDPAGGCASCTLPCISSSCGGAPAGAAGATAGGAAGMPTCADCGRGAAAEAAGAVLSRGRSPCRISHSLYSTSKRARASSCSFHSCSHAACTHVWCNTQAVGSRGAHCGGAWAHPAHCVRAASMDKGGNERACARKRPNVLPGAKPAARGKEPQGLQRQGAVQASVPETRGSSRTCVVWHASSAACSEACREARHAGAVVHKQAIVGNGEHTHT